MSLTFIAPCVPTLVQSPPMGSSWLHEPKLDGWRLQIVKSGGLVGLLSRRGNDIAGRLPVLSQRLARLKGDFRLDAELLPVAGSFWWIARSIAEEAVVLGAFDLLQLGDNDTRSMPVTERKRRLTAFVARARLPELFTVPHFDDGAALLAEAETRGLEGIVSKRRGASYRSGRRPEWVKVKTVAWREANRERWRKFAR